MSTWTRPSVTLPPEGQPVLVLLRGRPPMRVRVAFYHEAAVLDLEVEPWPGCVWHDGQDGNPAGDGELHAPPGWHLLTTEEADGGDYASLWLGGPEEHVLAWCDLPTVPETLRS